MSDKEILPHGNDAEVDETIAPSLPKDSPHWLPEANRPYRFAKRLLDIVGSLLALVLLLPLFAAIATIIRLTSRGPVFFRQIRLGYHARPFVFLKFRTMHTGTDPRVHQAYVQYVVSRASQARAGQPTAYKLNRDPRVTIVGQFLRRASLDELPQILNVLMGDMSFVGPRPPIPYEWECYKDWHKLRLSCKPGITGLWQVKGRSRASFDDMVRLDLEYAKHPSILLDLRILFATPRAVLTDEGAY